MFEITSVTHMTLTVTHHNAARGTVQGGSLPEEELSDQKLISRALDFVDGIRSSYAAAEELGVSDSTVRRWRELRADGEPYPPLQERTRNALRSTVGMLGLEERLLTESARIRHRRDIAERGRPKDYLNPDVPAPERLLLYLQHLVGVGEVARELADKDLVAAAYTLARRHRFDAEAYEILDYERDAILEEEGVRQPTGRPAGAADAASKVEAGETSEVDADAAPPPRRSDRKQRKTKGE